MRFPRGSRGVQDASSPRRVPKGVSRLVLFLSVGSLILTFFPYLAIPLGANTNIPWSAVVGLCALVLAPTVVKTDAALWLVALLPFVAHASSTILLGSKFPLSGELTWITVSASFGIGMMLVKTCGSHLGPIIAMMIIATASFTVIQYVLILGGVLPFAEWYQMPGYANVAGNASTIVDFIRRPFGQFPEPSFLAGTLLLALTAMVLSSRSQRDTLRRSERVATAFGCLVILLSRSGVAVAGLGLLSIVILAAGERTLKSRVVGLSLVVIGVLGGVSVLEERGGAHDFSWGDRLNSISVSLQYWISDPFHFLLGLGRGGLVRAFNEGRISLTGFDFTESPQDVWSVLARIAIESGLIAGGMLLAVVALQVGRVGGEFGWLVASCAVLIWMLVAGLSISYESAAWLWVFPGICRGLRIRPSAGDRDSPTKAVQGTRSGRLGGHG